MSRATGGRRRLLCAPGSRLPPPRSFSLLPPTAIGGKRRSPPPRFFLPFPRAPLLPREKPARPSIAPPACPAPGTHRRRPCRPPGSFVSPPSNPAQSAPSRSPDAAESVSGAIGLAGAIPSSRPGSWD
ncbi:hypothetical protein PVAP13_9KG433546 [Panicum virgatum]|uniref:Uncharacterized protein n=1 Tax=Panicum virgatum TaxID=38727 RepID=A0A8T0NSB8_PANVG|nr:hypothetical protein PVAP13_9KG433546 [Panicum virgatum]